MSSARRETVTQPPFDGRELPALPAAAQGLRGRLKILLIASLFKMPYRVLRCAAASGTEVYVLGSPAARGLRLSRYCRGWISSRHSIDGSGSEGLGQEIDSVAGEYGIAMVVPGDAPATRSLIACREQVRTPVFPLPGLATFDLLNDKWQFTRLCAGLGLRCPESRLFNNLDELSRALAAGEIPLPAVAKPLSMSGSEGFCRLDGPGAERRLDRIDYGPIIVQDFVAGTDASASIFARSGEIEAFIAYRHGRGIYRSFRSDRILAEVTRLARHLALDGLYNFDMRLTDDGRIYYVECNPRVFFTIDSALIAGINFLAHGLPGSVPQPHLVMRAEIGLYRPKALAVSPARWLRCDPKDRAMARHLYSDPVPHLLESAHILA